MARAAPAPAPAPAAAGGGAEGGGADGGAGVLAGSLLAEGLPRGVSLTGFSAVGDLPRGHYALPPEVREVPAAAAPDEARAADRASRLRELEKFPLSSVTRYDADEAARRERGLPDDKRAVAVRRPDGSVAKSRGELTFYGAFTGGFSAGYWNTVGSKEGWAPSTFVSSRSKRAEQPANQVEDLMDEEDLQNLQDHRRVLDRGAEERRSLGEPPEAPGAHASRPRAGREQQQRGADGLSYEGLLAASGGGRGGRSRGRAAPCAAAEEAPAEEEAPRPSGAAGGALDAARDGRRLYMQSKRGRGTARAHAYGDFGTGVFDKEDRDAWEDIYHAGDGRAEYDVALAVADREDDKDLEAEGDRRLEDRRLAGLEDVRASCAAVLKADGVQGLPGLEDPLLPEALREDLVEFKVGSSSRVFVGGLPKGCTDEMLSDYFSAFGIITEAAVKKDMESGKSRGFGFVAFESAGSVDAVMADYEKHRIEDKWVEVKRAISQETLEFKERHGSARLLLQREEDELREREELRARCEPPGAAGPLQAPAEAAGGSSASTAPGPDAQQQRALVQSAGPLWRAVSEENKKALLKNLGRAFVTGLEQDMDGKTARHEPFKSDPKKQKRYTAFCLALEGKASASEALRDGGGLGEAEREAELADFGRVYRLFRRDNPDADIEAVLQPAAGPSLAPALQRTVQAWAPDKLLCKRWRVPAPEQDGAEGASLQASAKRQKAYSAQVQRGLARAAWDAAPGGAPAAAAAPGPRGAAPGERQAAARARCPQGPPPGSLFSAMFGDEDS